MIHGLNVILFRWTVTFSPNATNEITVERDVTFVDVDVDCDLQRGMKSMPSGEGDQRPRTRRRRRKREREKLKTSLEKRCFLCPLSAP